MEKTFNLVGVSTQGKITKFRVANGDKDARIKVLERAGCTDINFIQLETAVTKMAAIDAYKAQFPESADIRMPNEKDGTDSKITKSTGAKTVTIKRGNKKVNDAATELLNAVDAG